MKLTSLSTWAAHALGGKIEFTSERALQHYLSEHPNADASKHSVNEKKREHGASDPSTASTKVPEGLTVTSGKASKEQIDNTMKLINSYPGLGNYLKANPVSLNFSDDKNMRGGVYHHERYIDGKLWPPNGPSITVSSRAKNPMGLAGDVMPERRVGMMAVHELGHHIHSTTLGYDSPFVSTAFDRAKKDGKFISDYAKANPREYWAENFLARLHMTREQHYARDPIGAKMVDDALKAHEWPDRSK